MCGDRAFKVKKPIATDFLDFSTQELRERACARELELNRRMAPDVYLGIAHLVDPTSRSSEPVLVMRRMPDDRRLSALVADPSWDDTRLSSLVGMLARFHDRARRGPDIDAEGEPEALRGRWLSLIRPLRGRRSVDADRLARIERLALDFIDGRAPLFTRRVADGMIVDGHGDLLAQDIFDLPDGFRVLDCLDFDDKLRCVDRLDDIAFLAMDLEFRGHGELGAALLADYRRRTADPAPDALVHHYLAYRALVRAKVDLIRYDQGEQAADERAQRHLAITEQHLADAAVRLVLVGGLPGTGKSTVAGELAAATGATVLSSDRVRRELFAADEIDGAPGAYGAGLYSPAHKARVYRELLARARALLASGVSVILDASWIEDRERRAARALATQLTAESIELECVCPAAVAAARIGARHGGDSDATAAIAADMAVTGDAWPEAVRLDTDRAPERTLADAVRIFRTRAEYEMTVLPDRLAAVGAVMSSAISGTRKEVGR
ncbi:bifunctional aminoglycoside phosphotransferase/ATP-binding protein [Nocardia arizonensis]|uniref:bifunctional aminoglycoside phosphotransferase/ATP-binding protein n=1 Tax=Nocardia arizonensis TaxID=1141647 RepID=UPI001EF5A4AE|nr:AAA family ATPase [Nocardia arizonensis]